MLLFAFLCGVLVMVAKRIDATWALIGASLGVLGVADTIYGYQEIAGTFVEGTYLDLLWPLSAVLLGMAAWSPGSAERASEGVGWRSIGTPSLFALAACALLVYGTIEPLEPLAVVMAAAALAAVGVRFVLTYRENEQALRPHPDGRPDRPAQPQSPAARPPGRDCRRRPPYAVDPADARSQRLQVLQRQLRASRRRRPALPPLGAPRLRGHRRQRVPIGGDEFCVLLPAASEPSHGAAARVAASLRNVARPSRSARRWGRR